MLALLTQPLVEKIFACQRSGIQHWGLSGCEPHTLFPLLHKVSTLPHLNGPTTPATPYSNPTTHTYCTQTRSTHGCMCVHSQTHTRTQTHTCAARWVKWPSEPTDEKTPQHKQALLMQGEALLFCGTMSVLTFLCLHNFKHQKQQKEWKKEVRKACDRGHRHVQTYTNSPFISQSQTIFYSAIMLASSSVSLRIWWRYIWAANLALAHLPPLTHKRHFTL